MSVRQINKIKKNKKNKKPQSFEAQRRKRRQNSNHKTVERQGQNNTITLQRGANEAVGEREDRLPTLQKATRRSGNVCSLQ